MLLLTGPNMAGKSTFLRQAALAVVLAQAGLPVPAERAEIGLVDRLFSRVGAADDLARGRSTFMVEMIETAAILNQAGPRSLVVVDEIGRGTSTLDGLAIAWAVLEALHAAQRCRTDLRHPFPRAGAAAGAPAARVRRTRCACKEWGATWCSCTRWRRARPGGAGACTSRGWPGCRRRWCGGRRRCWPALEAAGPAERHCRCSPRWRTRRPAHPRGPERAGGGVAAIDPDRLTPREALEALYAAAGAACASDDELSRPGRPRYISRHDDADRCPSCPRTPPRS